MQTLHKEIREKVDEIWCLSVNDVFVMNAWGIDQKVEGRVRMIADGRSGRRMGGKK